MTHIQTTLLTQQNLLIDPKVFAQRGEPRTVRQARSSLGVLGEIQKRQQALSPEVPNTTAVQLPQGCSSNDAAIETSMNLAKTAYSVWHGTVKRLRSANGNGNDGINQIASELLHVLVTTTAMVTYQGPSARKDVGSQLRAAQQDPFLAALLGLIVVALLRSLCRVPRLIIGLSDDCVNLQTALGEDLKIPSLHWQSFSILHGLLETHFQDRPGRSWVMRKSYRIMIGGTGGAVVDASKWSAVVSKGMMLTMAMVVDDDWICPRCNQLLEAKGHKEKFCSSCTETFWSLQHGTDIHVDHDEAVPKSRSAGPSALAQKQAYWLPQPDPGPLVLHNFDEIASFVNVLLSDLLDGTENVKAKAMLTALDRLSKLPVPQENPDKHFEELVSNCLEPLFLKAMVLSATPGFISRDDQEMWVVIAESGRELHTRWKAYHETYALDPLQFRGIIARDRLLGRIRRLEKEIARLRGGGYSSRHTHRGATSNRRHASTDSSERDNPNTAGMSSRAASTIRVTTEDGGGADDCSEEELLKLRRQISVLQTNHGEEQSQRSKQTRSFAQIGSHEQEQETFPLFASLYYAALAEC